MKGNFLDPLARYAAQVHAGFDMNYRHDKGLTAALVALGWFLLPFLLQTLLHPTDMIWMQCKLQGLRVPQFYTMQQWYFAVAVTAFLLVVLVVFQMVGMVLFYRRAQMVNAPVATPALWPLAALFAGVFGNAAWIVATGSFDPSGCVIGLVSAAITIFGEMVTEGLGRDFVLGSAASNLHPQMRNQSW
jgi:hypothetical protein